MAESQFTVGITGGSYVYSFDLDTVTNVSGSYTHTTNVSGVTSDLKCVLVECGNPSVFGAPITVTTGSGTIELTCSSVSGTSTVRVTLMKQGSSMPIMSSEYTELSSRIGSLSSLTTTNKTSIVNALNSANIPRAEYQYGSGYDKTIINVVGDIAFINVYGTSVDTLTAITLPEGVRPTMNVFIVGALLYDSKKYIACLGISPNGAINVSYLPTYPADNISAGNWPCYFSGSYVLS